VSTYALVMWHNTSAVYEKEENARVGKAPHMSALCEACAEGVCDVIV
jgi:hypothetical protein